METARRRSWGRTKLDLKSRTVILVCPVAALPYVAAGTGDTLMLWPLKIGPLWRRDASPVALLLQCC
jgi:hypothetical protein